MDGSWQEVAAKLAGLGLPVLGKLVGGNIPVVGPVINMLGGGEAVGRIIAQGIALALGVKPTPEAVSEAIDNGNTTEVVAKLKAVEAEAAARWPAVAEINKSADSADVEIAKINAEASARIATDLAGNSPTQSLYRPILLWGASLNLIVTFIVFNWAMISDVFFNGNLLSKLQGSEAVLVISISLATLILGWHFSTRASERKAAVNAPANAAARAAAAAVGK